MAFNAGTVKGALELSTKGFVNSIKRAREGLKRFTRGNREAGEGMKRFRSAMSLMRDMVIVFPALFKAATAPLRKFLGFLKESSAAAAEFETEVRSLSAALALKGVKSVNEATDALVEYAGQLQAVTKFSDGVTVQVSRLLTVFGVPFDKIKQATKTTLDFASALNVDASAAARQFASTLGGSTGTLGRYFPQVRQLTAEQLKAGGAFELAAKLVGGFSEEVAKTTEGIRAQFVNAFGDLQKAVGFAINPVLDAITKAATEALVILTEKVNAGRETITGVAVRAARTILGFVRRLVSASLNIPAMIHAARALIGKIRLSFLWAIGDARTAMASLGLDFKRDMLSISEALEMLPLGLGTVFESVTDSMRISVGEATQHIAGLEEKIGDAVKPVAKLVAEQEAAAIAAREHAQAVRDGTEQTGAMAAFWKAVSGTIDVASGGLDNAREATEAITSNTRDANSLLEERLAHLREMNGVTMDAADATGDVADKTKEAADNAGDLAAQMSDAARAAGQAADEVTRAATAATTRAGGTRRVVGETAIETAGKLESALAGQRAALFGAHGISRAAAAGTVVEGIVNTLRAQIREETAAFTSGIISELNTRGIFDASERQRIIAERTTEAERLGIIPSERLIPSYV